MHFGPISALSLKSVVFAPRHIESAPSAVERRGRHGIWHDLTCKRRDGSRLGLLYMHCKNCCDPLCCCCAGMSHLEQRAITPCSAGTNVLRRNTFPIPWACGTQSLDGRATSIHPSSNSPLLSLMFRKPLQYHALLFVRALWLSHACRHAPNSFACRSKKFLSCMPSYCLSGHVSISLADENSTPFGHQYPYCMQGEPAGI